MPGGFFAVCLLACALAVVSASPERSHGLLGERTEILMSKVMTDSASGDEVDELVARRGTGTSSGTNEGSRSTFTGVGSTQQLEEFNVRLKKALDGTAAPSELSLHRLLSPQGPTGDVGMSEDARMSPKLLQIISLYLLLGRSVRLE